MHQSIPNPIDLLLSFGSMTKGQIEAAGRAIYEDTYVGRVRTAHDGERVYFYSNRFEHAFHGSDSATSGAKKEGINERRVERIHWIGELIEGRIPGSLCLLVNDQDGNRPARRLYVYRAEHYIVWLEPRIKEGEGWWFSSAYIPFGYQIKKYEKNAVVIARF